MKILPLKAIISLLVIFLCSCSTYQYATLRSKETDETKGIVIENDSVKIVYTFKGENCPIQIQVANKLSQPIFIDWKKSALVLNDERFSYWKDKAVLNATTHGYEVQWSKNISSTSSTTQGEFIRDEQVSCIPPHSFVKASPITVKDSFFKFPKEAQKEKIVLIQTDPPTRGDKYSFSKETSPLRFRSYLTLSTTENFATTFHFDDEFWVSEIIATGASTAELHNPSSTQFTLRKRTGFAKAMTVIITIPILVWLAVAGSHSR
jgi:hypothetical protein